MGTWLFHHRTFTTFVDNAGRLHEVPDVLADEPPHHPVHLPGRLGLESRAWDLRDVADARVVYHAILTRGTLLDAEKFIGRESLAAELNTLEVDGATKRAWWVAIERARVAAAEAERASPRARIEADVRHAAEALEETTEALRPQATETA